MKKITLIIASLCMVPFWSPAVLSQSVPTSIDGVAVTDNEINNPSSLTLEKVAQGFEGPVNIANAGDGSGRIFVVERAGKIKIIDKSNTVLPKPFLNLTTLRPTVINPVGNDVQSSFIEQGLFSIAFHPDFSKNGHLFVHYSSVKYKGAGVVSRFTVDQESPNYISTNQARKSEKIVMIIEQPSENNNGGEIAFGPDGFLYIAVGDGGWNSPKNVSQEHSSRLGKILRVDIDTDQPFLAPEQNPFASMGGTPENEIWAKGFHNPYKFSFDKKTGDLFVADVGDNSWEEINFVPRGASAESKNFGWPIMEGSYCYSPVTAKKKIECNPVGVLPIAQYKHPEDKKIGESSKNFSCASVQGFGVANYPNMERTYMFGDWCSGKIYGVSVKNDKWKLDELMHTDLHLTAGGNDEDGNVIALSAKFYFDEEDKDKPPYGTVWRIVKP